MKLSNKELHDLAKKRDHRALSRIISLIENRTDRGRELQRFICKGYTKKAHVLGITGSPGAGKSTLVDQLALSLTKQGRSVAIIAVDPTSPFTGGAILGDRIRMVDVVENTDVFLRSMATRGSLGGVASATLEVVELLDAVGFDSILIETVGVGQAEVDIVRLAHTCVVVLVPGMGDSVQAFKAGLLEIADIFAINKADRDGSDLVMKDIRLLISLGEYDQDTWKPSIVKTVAIKSEGVPELLEEITKHSDWLVRSPIGYSRRLNLVRHSLLHLVEFEVRQRIAHTYGEILDRLSGECMKGKIDLRSAVNELLSLEIAESQKV